MREFFHGWRRKTGCVTLLLALAALAAWGRSQITRSRFSADTVTIPFGGGIEYWATLHAIGFCFLKTRHITIRDNETLSCRDGDFVISGVNESSKGNQSLEKVDLQPDGNCVIRMLALTNQTTRKYRRDPSYGNPALDNLSNPYPMTNGNDGWQLVSITGPTTVLVDCGQLVIPYWYLITPMTLISAVLLLTRSRVAPPKESFEPINDQNA